MKEFPLEGENSKPDSPIKKIIDGALGVPIVLSSSPTTTGGQLASNEIGFDGTNLFITINGNTYRISLTLV